MIVGLLKHKIELSLLTLFSTCVILSIYYFSVSKSVFVTVSEKEYLFYDLIFKRSEAFSFSYKLINLCLIFFGAYAINIISVKNELINKGNFLPAFLYLVFSFSSITSSEMQPILISNLFLIFSFHLIFKSSSNENAFNDSFNIGLLISLASCFFTYYFLLIPLIMIAFLLFKSFNWREHLCFLVGVFTPIYFYESISYLSENDFAKPFLLFSSLFKHPDKPLFSEYDLPLIFTFIFLTIMAFIYYINKGFGNKIKIQSAKKLLIWFGLLCFMISVLDASSLTLLLPCAIPLSIIIGDYIYEIKRLKIANTLLSALILCLLLVYFHQLNWI
ncbi:MAG: DUF6427 family protein [Bacteroidota bacterium]